MGAQKNVTLTELQKQQKLAQQTAQIPPIQPGTIAPIINQPGGNITQGAIQPPPIGAAPVPAPAPALPPPAPVPGAPPPAAQPTQQELTQQVQQQILGRAESPLLQQIIAQAQGRLADPTLGVDLAAQTERQLSQFDVDLARRFEGVRRATPGLAAGGAREQVLAEEALTAAQERGRFGAELERGELAQTSQLAAQAQQQALAALGAERGITEALIEGIKIGDPLATRQLEEKLATLSIESQQFLSGFDRETQLLLADRSEATQSTLADINNKFQEGQLLTKLDFDGIENALDREAAEARQAGDIEGQKQIELLRDQFATQRQESDQAFQSRLAGFDRGTQELLTNLKAEIDEKSFVRQSDFTATQNQLQKDFEFALQTNDTDKALQIQQMQNDLAQTLQASQLEFRTSERIANNGWQTQERLSAEDFEKSTRYLENEFQVARDANNIESEERLTRLQSDLRLKEITQEMDENIRLTFIQDELQTARDNGDVGRQKDLIRFQTSQNIETIRVNQGFEAGQAELGRLHDVALQEGDLVGQRELTRMQHQFQADENLKDRELEHLRLEFQKVGQDFDQIFNAVDAGAIDPSAIGAFLQEQLPQELRDQIKPFDADAAMRESIDADYRAQLYQFAKSNPQFAVQGTDGELTPEGEALFNDFVNRTLFGSATQPIGTQLALGDISDAEFRIPKDDPRYLELLEQTSQWVNTFDRDPNGFWHPDVGRFKAPPAKGTLIENDGTVYRVSSDLAVETRGQDYEYFTALDLSTGTTKTFRARI